MLIIILHLSKIGLCPPFVCPLYPFSRFVVMMIVMYGFYYLKHKTNSCIKGQLS